MTSENPQGLPEESPATSKQEINHVRNEIKRDIDQSLSPKERKLQKLRERRESGTLDPYDLDLNFLFQLQQAGDPLTRNDLKNQAVVLTREDFDQLGSMEILLANGESIVIDSESLPEDDVLIMYPEDLG